MPPSSRTHTATPTPRPPYARQTSSNERKNTSSSLSSPVPTPANASATNLVTHLRDLLPLHKHATFHVKVAIHELYSVPFISGQFRIKWKFEDLVAVDKDGKPLGFGKALARKLERDKKKKESADSVASPKGKEKEREKDDDMDVDSPLNDLPHILHGDIVASPPPRTTSLPTAYDNFDLTPDISPDQLRRSDPILHYPPPSPTKLARPPPNPAGMTSSSKSSPKLGTLDVDFRTDARGFTEFYPLDHFKVKFETEIDAAVQMSIEKETLKLMSSTLKLTVLQLVIPGDPAAPPNPRLGHVCVDLAEYANLGPVTRNYLLRRSKVNALLRMTLTVTQIAGETEYHAPPLRKEEIKAGISDYLNGSEFHLPLFSDPAPLEDPWLDHHLKNVISILPASPPPEHDDLELALPEVVLPRSDSRSTKKKKLKKAGTMPGGVDSMHPPPPVPPLPSTSLPVPTPSKRRKPLHPNELLIEAIFNPYASTEERPSPFTYHVPHLPVDLTAQSNSRSAHSRSGSMGTSDTTSQSQSQGMEGSFEEVGAGAVVDDKSMNGSGTSGGSGVTRWWRRKHASRPTTPAHLHDSPGKRRVSFSEK
ncbi:hypothetical protein M422DRAFT_784675 [Sphaerobolus stellatus SS14]|uniref:C2 NT-type domain-containing protein n=1 Tax=Sphaerobolus stellatus (strain SS14) TaxID=990650 RepID=A0A0C9UG55_SPHS4|nr:hypothetical protein M422DRAFT_784675 [Sphaerobolus stellatus SS14]